MNRFAVVALNCLGLAVAALLCAIVVAAEDEERVAKDKLPEPIRKALGQVEPREIERETEDGVTFYEVELSVAGQEVELRLSAEGTLLGLVVEGGEGADEAKPAANAAAEEQEREVTEAEVPAKPLQTLKEMAAGAPITEFAEEIEYGHKFYEGSWKSAAGTNTDVLVTETGDAVEIEEAIDVSKTPAAALAAARKVAGESAEMQSEKKTAFFYELKFRKDGKRHELLLTPDGRTVEEEVEDAGGEENEDE